MSAHRYLLLQRHRTLANAWVIAASFLDPLIPHLLCEYSTGNPLTYQWKRPDADRTNENQQNIQGDGCFPALDQCPTLTQLPSFNSISLSSVQEIAYQAKADFTPAMSDLGFDKLTALLKPLVSRAKKNSPASPPQEYDPDPPNIFKEDAEDDPAEESPPTAFLRHKLRLPTICFLP